MKTVTILTLLLLTFTAYAKGGGNNNNNSNPNVNSACNLGSADNRYWHKNLTNHPYKKITCDFKEYLKIDSKGPHCGSNTKARVIYLENCAINGVPTATSGIAMTTYYPGYGCWNNQEIEQVDALGFDKMNAGTQVVIIEGEWGGMGYGSGVNIAQDIHQISVEGRDFCPTEHSIVPHVMMSVNPENDWLRESY